MFCRNSYRHPQDQKIRIETGALIVNISSSGRCSDDDPYESHPTLKNGKLEGKAFIYIWQGAKKEREYSCHVATFKDGKLVNMVDFKKGKIVQNNGIKKDILKTIEIYLDKLYSVKCDVNYVIKENL